MKSMHGNKRGNKDDWDTKLKYLYSLAQNAIDDVSATTDVSRQEQRQQYIVDLRDKYANIANQFTKKNHLTERK